MAVFGDTLRQARAHKGVTLREAEQKTRINRHHLLALEEERFQELPALIYQRGIVKNYGVYLELDPNKLLKMFEDARGIDPLDRGTRAPERPPVDMPQHFSPNFAIIAFLVVMSAVVFAWMYSVYFAPPGARTTPTEVIPTVTPLGADSKFAPSPIIPAATSTPNTTVTATITVSNAAPTQEPTREATAKPASTKEANSNSSEIVSTTGNSSNANASPGNASDGNASSGSPSDVNAAHGNVSDGNASEIPTNTPASGEMSLDFVATSDLASLTVVADGNVVFDGPLVTGDATGYIPGSKFDINVSDPNGLLIYKDGKSFQMGDSTFSLP
jgi:cytoskeleton protein RodZ